MKVLIIFCLFFSIFVVGQENLQKYREKLQLLKKRMEQLQQTQNHDEGGLKKQLQKELNRLASLKIKYERLLQKRRQEKKNIKGTETALKKSLAKIAAPSKILTSEIEIDYLAVGDIYWKKKQYQKAWEAYLKTKNANEPFALYKIACAHEKNGDWKKASNIYSDIYSASPGSVVGEQAAWNKNYLQWKQQFIAKLGKHLSEQDIRKLLDSTQKISPAVSKSTDADDIKTTVTKNERSDTEKSLGVNFPGEINPVGKQQKTDKAMAPANKKQNPVFWSKQAITLVTSEHVEPGFSRLNLAEQKQKLANLLAKVEQYRSKLILVEKELIDDLDRNLDSNSEFFLPEVFEVIDDVEKYHRELERRIAGARHALQEKSRYVANYALLLPYANLDEDGSMRKAIALADRKISSQMKFARIKARGDVPGNQVSGQSPYMGAWYPSLLYETSRLQTLMSRDLANPKIAAYRSRVKNYIARFKSYPEEVAFLVKEISSLNQSKEWKIWKKSHIGSGQDSQNSLALQKFLKTQSLNPPLEQEIKRLRREIRKLEHIGNNQNIGDILEKVLSYLGDIHEIYMQDNRNLREAVLQFASST